MSKTEQSTADSEHSREQLWNLVKDIRFAMFTTRHANGHLHSRPMTTQNTKLDEDSSLWFFMSRAGEPVADLTVDQVVNVVYADPGRDSYVSVSGIAAVIEDSAKKKQLWSKLAEAWFPGGPTDADLALVQVRIVHASYWDIKENKLVQLFQMAKAVITGTPPTRLGEQAEIHMG